ncbi:DUF418 domain-containing protein [Bacillus sp. NPDC060175]|uniref:DUF418 domain-containing protein n=1 Tax=Bacillus sp. NPDC060175 TaxID=3347061 RepID=UPI00364FF6A4
MKFSQYLCVNRKQYFRNIFLYQFFQPYTFKIWRKKFSRGPIEWIMRKLAG